MRIAVVASLVTPLREAQPGGAQAFLTDLARELARRAHDVTVYCADGSALPGVRLVTVPPPAAVERALVMPAGRPPPAVPGLRDAFARLFDAVRGDGCDAVTQHAFDAEAFELAAGLPVLHTLHLPPLVPAVVAAVRAAGAPCVTVSAATCRAWARAGVEVGVIRNGVPEEAPPDVAVEQRALIAGRVSPEKGTAAAILAARRAGLEPLVVGSVYDRGYWERAVRQAVEPVDRAGLRRLMAGSAVALMPVEWDEPFGMVAAEAQMAGCPVVGYRRGGLPEVVVQGVGGFLVGPGDLDGLVAAIPAAVALDRRRVRDRARRRLGIGRAAAAYAAALAAL